MHFPHTALPAAVITAAAVLADPDIVALCRECDITPERFAATRDAELRAAAHHKHFSVGTGVDALTDDDIAATVFQIDAATVGKTNGDGVRVVAGKLVMIKEDGRAYVDIAL